MDLQRLVAQRAERSRSVSALETPKERLDYAALERRARKVGAALAGAGAREGRPVATLLDGGLPFATLAHAALRCGAVLLPLNTRLAVPELARQLADAEAALLVHDGGALEEAAREAAREAGVPSRAWRELDGGASGALPDTPRDPRLPSTLVYTSGTTGTPKGALLTPANFAASALASALQLGVLPGDRWLACLPLFHVGGLSILWRCALAGTTAVLHERFDAERVSETLDAERITQVSLTATMLQRVLDARGARFAPPTLRCVLLGGGPCPGPLLERAAAQGFPVAPTYGLTEAASQVATRPPGAPRGAGLTPLLGTEVRIVSERGAALPAGAEGEILVRGPTVMAGYWRRPEASAAALAGGWLHTGDAGRLDAAGDLLVLDRRDDLIVSGGENVYPAEIEAVLLAHPAVAEVGVTGIPDPEFGSRPCAWWVARPGAPATDDDTLRRHCRERLAGYKVPVAFHRVPELPRTAAGKLRRAALREGA